MGALHPVDMTAGTDGDQRPPAYGAERPLGDVIAERVREFRRQAGWTVGELAQRSDLSKSMLSKIENAQASPSLASLARLAEALLVPVTAFFRGLDEQQDILYIKGGTGVEMPYKTAHNGQRHQLLGRLRAPHDRFEPMLVTVTSDGGPLPMYQHGGTELIYMLTGKMEYGCGRTRYLLAPGDALHFVGEVPHGPARLIQLPLQFLAIKAAPNS